MSENIRVAIDGPSGAGKSTLARSVAARLNFLYVDTGAIYRTIGYAVWRMGIDPRDRSAVVAVLQAVRPIGQANLQVRQHRHHGGAVPGIDPLPPHGIADGAVDGTCVHV